MLRFARVVSVFALISMTGCFSYGVRSRQPTDGVLHTARGPVYAWGLAGQEHLTPECENGVARAKSSMPWWGGFVSLVTIGIVTPWRVEYSCAAPEGMAAAPATPVAASTNDAAPVQE
ncbi:MAG: hypothetical protein U0230_12365 [Polyangiales bacterium]